MKLLETLGLIREASVPPGFEEDGGDDQYVYFGPLGHSELWADFHSRTARIDSFSPERNSGRKLLQFFRQFFDTIYVQDPGTSENSLGFWEKMRDEGLVQELIFEASRSGILRDNNGKPLRLYHGTARDFKQFSLNVLGQNTNASTSHLGLFFTNSPSVASSFANRENGNVRPVYLTMNKPFVIEASSIDYVMKKSSYEMNYMRDAPLRRHYHPGKDPFQQLHDIRSVLDPDGSKGFSGIREHLISRGFDGIIVRDTYMDSPNGVVGGMHDFYIVFSPDQVHVGIGSINEATWWHGTGSGDLRGGPSGLHLGTKLAATQALCARIGYPAEGEWDGTREYGKTLLAGKERLRRIDPSMQTGYNVRAPDHDYYAHQHQDGLPHVSKGVRIDPKWKPAIKEYELTGPMSNTPNNPHDDWKANGYMKGNLKKGKARRGFYYVNDGEDTGSISITVPGPSHIRALGESHEGRLDVASTPPEGTPARSPRVSVP